MASDTDSKVKQNRGLHPALPLTSDAILVGPRGGSEPPFPHLTREDEDTHHSGGRGAGVSGQKACPREAAVISNPHRGSEPGKTAFSVS